MYVRPMRILVEMFLFNTNLLSNFKKKTHESHKLNIYTQSKACMAMLEQLRDKI